MIDAPPAPEPTGLFRPDAFFLKPWRGYGVVRDARGRVVDRFRASGQGRSGTRAAASEQVFTFESGLVHTVEWDILSDDEDHYYARDLRNGAEARGRFQDRDFVWTFASPLPGPLGRLLSARTTARYTLASPGQAFGFTEVRCLGLLLRSYTAFYEHES